MKDCYSSDQKKLQDFITDKQLVVFYDETNDSEARFVSSILIAVITPGSIVYQPLLAELFFETEPLNFSKVAQLVMKLLNNYNIPFENIIGYCSDNASYMLCPFNRILTNLLPKCWHLTCICHLLNLIIREFLSQFQLIKIWSDDFSIYLRKFGARKFRFQKFLADAGFSQKLQP